MKKVISSIALLLICVSTWAGHWTSASVYDYVTSSPVYASLRINNGIANADTIVELAAFVDGTCRAVATVPSSNGKYLLRVVGDNSEVNKTIEYRAYYKGLEYALQPASASKFTGETAIVNLELSAITGVTTDNAINITANLPFDKTLSHTYLYQDFKGKNITPSTRSSVLSELTVSWNTFGASGFSVTGNTLHITGECIDKPIKCTVSGPKYGTEQFSKSCSTNLTASYPVSFNFPTLELDRFKTTSINLPNLVGIIFDPSLVEFQFPTVGGVPMAVTSYEQKNGKWYFNIYANMVGQLPYKVLYNGKPMMSSDNKETATVTVDATCSVPNGWSWLSLLATDEMTDNISLVEADGKYGVWAKTYIDEIRSQLYLLYNDTDYGLFGEITNLNVGDGMYKVKAKSATQFALGHKTSNGLDVVKQIRKGYNWFNNPYQLDITLSQLSEALVITPSQGDKVIGKNAFAEYDGTQWQASSSFLLEAGKGYIYYSTSSSNKSMSFKSNIGYTCNSSVNTLVSMPNTSGSRSRIKETGVPSPWSYDDSQFADNMVIVASLDGIDNPANYSIGAFVGDECRGEGEASESGRMFISVASKAGETISFKLYDKHTGEMTDLNESLAYAGFVGSISKPVDLTSDVVTTGVSNVNAVDAHIVEIHDMTGRKVNTMGRGTYLVTYNNNGSIVTKKVMNK
ncbi:MAG: hypothetical protein J5663_03085 [Bacteroidaceae bacterium]|nr:hypothetical protein [Bacteroidaceae bacterium]